MANKGEESKKETSLWPSEEEIKEYEKCIGGTPLLLMKDGILMDYFVIWLQVVLLKSMVSFGTGGVGKTYTLMQELSKLKLKEFDSDYSDINHHKNLTM